MDMGVVRRADLRAQLPDQRGRDDPVARGARGERRG
jgi:hypothetical protein